MAVTETPKPPQPAPPEKRNPESPEEPGLLDSVGSFPCWLLKAINTVTPDILRTKEPPKKNYRI